MFDRISGLPAHPLIVHAAVVFVPLLALGLIAYAVLPGFRRPFRWTVGILAVIAPLTVTAAVLSGREFSKNKNLQSAEVQSKISEHEDFGTMTLWLAIALGVVALVVVLLVRPASRVAADRGLGGAGTAAGTPLILQIVLGVVAVGLAAATVYYIFRTGDSGAKMVWTGF